MTIDKMATLNRKKSMTKKAFNEYNKSQRLVIHQNLGTRTHKSVKDYSRSDNKKEARNMMRNY